MGKLASKVEAVPIGVFYAQWWNQFVAKGLTGFH